MSTQIPCIDRSSSLTFRAEAGRRDLPPKGNKSASGAWTWYPLQLDDEALPGDVAALYVRWCTWFGWRPERKSEPWVPVGCCGPLLILGHCRPDDVAAPLPAWCFQPVRLGVGDYLRRLEETLQLVGSDSLLKGSVVEEHDSQKFPERFIRPMAPRAALQLLLEYFPLNDAERGCVLRLLSHSPGEEARALGVFGPVVDFLLRRTLLVDLRGVRAPVAEVLGSGVELAAAHRLVSVQGSALWVAADQGEGGALEDRLLNQLGEGWNVRVLRPAVPLAVNGQTAAAPAGGAAEEGRRHRMVIENRAVVHSRDAGDAFVPGEIRISERMAAELEAYDPRRPDRDPCKVFLRELSAAIRCGASDLHIEPGVDTARIRVRVDGVMEEWLEMGADFGQSVVGAAKEIVGLPAERFLPQDGSCTIHHCGAVLGGRVSSYPIRKKRQKLVLRLLPRRGEVADLSAVLPPWQARLMMRAARSPQGLILVCGPTGSGKTTTLFSVLAALNTPERNIMTMEDPVEYEIEGLNQAELDIHRGVSWDSLLKGFLRQDPDAGLVGEIRDKDTAEMAVRQALTGHVVFATLHTLSCSRTLERLLDMGISPDMLASALTLVEGQRLVRKLCPRCREVRPPSPEEGALFVRHRVEFQGTLWTASPQGCPHCRNGYRGRAAAVEILPIVDEVVRLIEQGARARAFEEWMAAEGLPTVFQSALRLAAEGITSLEEALEWQSVWGDFDWRSHS